jgi:hypothetical protein
MNGREKSHSAIVAVKPTNKAGRLLAEPPEPRAGTEGNAKPGRHALDSEPGKRVTWPGWFGKAARGGNPPDLDTRFTVKHPR